ncbi:MAG: hypothetical protein WBB01_22625 [Phormidesmis sp.]
MVQVISEQAPRDIAAKAAVVNIYLLAVGTLQRLIPLGRFPKGSIAREVLTKVKHGSTTDAQ